jgi:hypothetical protein
MSFRCWWATQRLRVRATENCDRENKGAYATQWMVVLVRMSHAGPAARAYRMPSGPGRGRGQERPARFPELEVAAGQSDGHRDQGASLLRDESAEDADSQEA